MTVDFNDYFWVSCRHSLLVLHCFITEEWRVYRIPRRRQNKNPPQLNYARPQTCNNHLINSGWLATDKQWLGSVSGRWTVIPLGTPFVQLYLFKFLSLLVHWFLHQTTKFMVRATWNLWSKYLFLKVLKTMFWVWKYLNQLIKIIS